MKIAVIAPTSIPAQRANTIQIMKMTQAISEMGYDVRLAVPAVEIGKGIRKEVDWAELSSLYGLRRKFKMSWLPAHPKMRRYDYGFRAVRWAQGWGADLVYTRLPQSAAIASLLGLATYYEVHDYPQGTAGPLLFRLFLKGRGARRLIVITRFLASDLAQRMGAPELDSFTVVAPDGVDLERYSDLPEPPAAKSALSLESDRLVAGYTGHFYAGRGVDLILDLAARLAEVTFLLMGGNPQDVASTQNEVRARKLENVILYGFVPNAELPKYQAACDYLLMPYQRRVEASSGGDIGRYLSPMKLFEYLACGRTILSSDLPVLREVLNPENAVLLPAGDIDAWVAEIQNLSEDKERGARLAEKARRDAVQYRWDARVKRIFAEQVI